MRFVITCAILCFAFITTANAQLTIPKKGDVDITLGIGLLPTFAADDARLIVPPLNTTLNYWITKDISIGSYVAFSSSKISLVDVPNAGDIYTWQNDYLILGMRGLVHFSRQDNWDTYGGILIGVHIPNVTQAYESGPVQDKDLDIAPVYTRPAHVAFAYTGVVGATYYPAQNFGVYGELSFGISIITVGLSYKI